MSNNLCYHSKRCFFEVLYHLPKYWHWIFVNVFMLFELQQLLTVIVFFSYSDNKKRWLCFVPDYFIDYRWHRHFKQSNENNLNFLLCALDLSTHISFVGGWHYVMFSLQFPLLTAQEHMFLGWNLQHSCRLAILPQQYLYVSCRNKKRVSGRVAKSFIHLLTLRSDITFSPSPPKRNNWQVETLSNF